MTSRLIIAAFAIVATLHSRPATAETALITGANRGIGLEMARQLAAQNWTVIATSRSPDDDDQLRQLAATAKTVRVERLDLTDHPGIDALAAKLKDVPIDLLINNAATSAGQFFDKFGAIQYDQALTLYTVNALGALKVSEAFVEHVATGKLRKIVTLIGEGGSTGGARGGGMYLFGASKAAEAHLMRKLALDLRKRNITVAIVAPGYVDTMGFADGTYSVEAAPDFKPMYDLYTRGDSTPVPTDRQVARLIPFMLAISPEQSGKWLSIDGGEVPW